MMINVKSMNDDFGKNCTPYVILLSQWMFEMSHGQMREC